MILTASICPALAIFLMSAMIFFSCCSILALSRSNSRMALVKALWFFLNISSGKKKYFSDVNFPEWTKSQAAITTSLVLPEESLGRPFGEETTTACLKCSKEFPVPSQGQELVAHLTMEHFIIIDEIQLIADIPTYLDYYRRKLEHTALKDFAFIHRVKVTSKDKGENVEGDIFIICDRRAEDRDLRIQLQMKRLEQVLEVQEKERTDPTFHRCCLFCRQVFEGCPAELFNHLAFDHNFSVGQPHNLVFVNDLLDLLEEKMDSMVCVFCEKTFKSREVLKEHMRKKGHKKINAKNAMYDKFYIVNYLEFGKNWEAVSKEQDLDEDDQDDLPNGFDSDKGDDENDWSDWRGDLQGAVCLFCPVNYTDIDNLLTHMTSIHDFDFQHMRNSLKLSFYQQVKLINYVRRQVHLNMCIFCSDKFETKDELLEHMGKSEHFKIPEQTDSWDQPEYFFPTYENDNLLHFLDDVDMFDKQAAHSVPVYPEDVTVKDSILEAPEFRDSICPPRRRQFKKK
eukprot:maker-scaffold486_size158769-snap-gene-0.29 protein:Tk09324 transcript:maker-scaffold486_size158769-snap-gene-0.29-mRNA-1 annotation:"zinc finger protein 277"